ncbi:MAG: glycosyltransferase [Solirubrobacteraceae bacterium]
MRVALAHDYLLVMRGAERTFAEMAACWPGAPIHTLLYDPEQTGASFAGHPVHPSVLQRLPVRQQGFRRLLPLMPAATRTMRPGPCDAVVTSTSAFAHGLAVPDGAVHVVYCHSPFRYAWFAQERARGELPRPLRALVGPASGALRRWDLRAASRVDHYIANGRITQSRIAEYYGRDVDVVHPPVAIDRFTAPRAPGDRLLLVGELVRHKRVEVALRAADRAGVRVEIVGTGPDEERLHAEYGDRHAFLGRVDDDALAAAYARARAVMVPNVEEFGIVAVEAQAAGCPVLAVAAGGALETVRDGVTGVLVPEGDDDAMAEALRETDFAAFDATRCREQAERFGPEPFRRRLQEQVDRAVAAGRRARATR